MSAEPTLPAAPAIHPHQAYLDASRAPLTGLWFTLPLFLFYHLGMWLLARFDESAWLSAADMMIAKGLGYLGAAAPLVSFVFVVFVFLVAQQASGQVWRWPKASVWGWMALESFFFALPVFLLSKATHYLIRDLRPRWLAARTDLPPPPGYPDAYGNAPAGDWTGVVDAPIPDLAPVADAASSWSQTLADLALSCGAGVYEEFLFRMVLLGLLTWVFRWWMQTGAGAAFLWPAVLQALMFSAFHHLPGSPDLFSWEVFAFRTVAGIYFAYLYLERGFGIAAGAHAGYDIITVVFP